MGVTISVIIPVYNSARYLRTCLEHLRTSTITDYECIVVDDGSTDNSADVAREFVISAAYFYFLIEGNHARIAGLALLKVFVGATALLFLAVFLTSSLHHGDKWLAVWIVFVMTGTVFMLGFPQRGEWRLLLDDGL